mgnify:CR=1 FL=1|jgi:uncharacterized membrane protein YkvA (DUF1232 family)
MSKFSSVRQVRGWRATFGLLQNRRTLWQMLRETLNGRYRMSFLTTLTCIGAIFYILFPFDLITDLIPVLGWIDDGLVFFLLVKRLQTETHRYNRCKAMARKSL